MIAERTHHVFTVTLQCFRLPAAQIIMHLHSRHEEVLINILVYGMRRVQRSICEYYMALRFGQPAHPESVSHVCQVQVKPKHTASSSGRN